jgi:hypothetical protein
MCAHISHFDTRWYHSVLEERVLYFSIDLDNMEAYWFLSIQETACHGPIAAVQIGLHRVILGQYEEVASANQLLRLCSSWFNSAPLMLDGEQAILKPLNSLFRA